jgi:ABC-2 type transport system ATP-binding protein
MMSEKKAIETRGLIKNYGRVKALKGVDLDVNCGEIFGFLGPNGAGKTTTIRCMLDMIRPQGGTIQVLGMDPQKDPVGVRARVGYLPGELSLEGNAKVINVLKYFDNLRGNNLDWDYVYSLAERIDLDLNRTVKNLSKGNKQKVGMVQALMHQPDLLILDEPTSGLDPLIQQEIYKLLHEAQARGATVFFSSHIIAEVEAIADRVAIIREGVIVEEAKPEQLVTMGMRRMRVRFIEPVDSPLSDVPGVTVVSHDWEDVVTYQVEGQLDGFIKALAAYPVSDIEIERSSLEEIFLTYYAGKELEVK